jgi:hypothetical protein
MKPVSDHVKCLLIMLCFYGSVLPSVTNAQDATASQPADRGRSPLAIRQALESNCVVQWRGETLDGALSQLAERLGARYIIDASVAETDLSSLVRMSATHLTGEQAFRWLARSAGLQAVLVGEVFIIAAGNRLPTVWRVTGRGGTERLPAPANEPAWSELMTRTADVAWGDAPLPGVASDVASGFRVDLIVHPLVLAANDLVHYEQADATLEQVRSALAEELGCKISYIDGALWAHPASVSARWAGQQSIKEAGHVVESVDADRIHPTEKHVKLDPELKTWQDFAARIEGWTGVQCVVTGAAEAACPPMRADGQARELLRAAELFGWIQWEYFPPQAEAEARFEIQVREKQ